MRIVFALVFALAVASGMGCKKREAAPEAAIEAEPAAVAAAAPAEPLESTESTERTAPAALSARMTALGGAAFAAEMWLRPNARGVELVVDVARAGEGLYALSFHTGGACSRLAQAPSKRREDVTLTQSAGSSWTSGQVFGRPGEGRATGTTPANPPGGVLIVPQPILVPVPVPVPTSTPAAESENTETPAVAVFGPRARAATATAAATGPEDDQLEPPRPAGRDGGPPDATPGGGTANDAGAAETFGAVIEDVPAAAERGVRVDSRALLPFAKVLVGTGGRGYLETTLSLAELRVRSLADLEDRAVIAQRIPTRDGDPAAYDAIGCGMVARAR